MLILIMMTSNAKHLPSSFVSSSRAVFARQTADAERAMTAACQRPIV